MANTPAFASTTKAKTANITAATTDYTGATTTNIVTLLTAGASGSKIFEIVVQVPVTSVAGFVQIWVDDAAAGTNRLVDVLGPISAITVAATTAPYRLSKVYDNFSVTALSVVKAGVSVINNPTVVTAFYADF